MLRYTNALRCQNLNYVLCVQRNLAIAGYSQGNVACITINEKLEYVFRENERTVNMRLFLVAENCRSEVMY